MGSLIDIRGDRREIARVMRELRVDECCAKRHLEQLRQLRDRLSAQRKLGMMKRGV